MRESTILRWGERWSAPQPRPPRLADLQNYGRLCGLARRRTDPRDLASGTLYKVRVNLEKAIMEDVGNRKDWIRIALGGDVFGHSSKQGVSFRLGLESCQPSRLCRDRCYAHDGRDAAPVTVRRGALNSLIARNWDSWNHLLFNELQPHIGKAVRSAWRESKATSFARQSRIRFSHVGDIAAYPAFANCIAWNVRHHATLEGGAEVICVTYTRRREAAKLDPNLWRVVFSLDASSLDRAKWIPAGALRAWAAFDGKANPDCDVSFAEHHGPTRMAIHHYGMNILQGRTAFVCPSTRIGYPHGCDNNCCDACFRGKGP